MGYNCLQRRLWALIQTMDSVFRRDAQWWVRNQNRTVPAEMSWKSAQILCSAETQALFPTQVLYAAWTRQQKWLPQGKLRRSRRTSVEINILSIPDLSKTSKTLKNNGKTKCLEPRSGSLTLKIYLKKCCVEFMLSRSLFSHCFRQSEASENKGGSALGYPLMPRPYPPF